MSLHYLNIFVFCYHSHIIRILMAMILSSVTIANKKVLMPSFDACQYLPQYYHYYRGLFQQLFLHPCRPGHYC